MTSVDRCRLIELPRIPRLEGALTPVEGAVDIPFAIERVYYLYDLPAGAGRGSHAHRELEQIFVSVMGSFTVTLKDGTAERAFSLDRAHIGLFVPRLIWRELSDFSGGSICLVLASLPYDENDYIREWDDYLQVKRSQ